MSDLKSAILAGESSEVIRLLDAQPHLLDEPIRWDGNETELLYFLVGLPFHNMLSRQAALPKGH